MNLFLRLAHFLWFLDFENPSTNKDFMAFQKNLVKSAKITFLPCWRLISNKTEIPWPPNSPDLNPLDFFSGVTP